MLDRVTAAALPWVLAIVLSACAALLLFLIVLHVGRSLRARRRDPLIEWCHEQVIDLLSADTDEEADAIRDELVGLRGRRWEMVVDEAFRMLPKFEGVAVERVIDLLDERGVMDERLACLSRGRPFDRAAAVQDLGNARWAPAAVPIARLLQHGHPSLRAICVRALGRIGDPATAGALLCSVADGHVHVGPAIEALEPMGDAITAEILSAFADPTPEVRWVAAAVAGENRIDAALPSLHTVVTNDPDHDVRRAAAAALGRMGHDASVPFLVLAGTGAPPLALTLSIIRALGQIGTDEAIEVLRWFANSGDAAARAETANAIADIPEQGLSVLRGLRRAAPWNDEVGAAFQRRLLATGVSDPENDPQWTAA